MSLALIDPREKDQITKLEKTLRVTFSEYRSSRAH
jgi:hypothetical protein